jgi:hypothetical protein
VTTDEIVKLIERKIKKFDRKLKEADIKVVIRLHDEQTLGETGLLLPKLAIMCSRDMTLIHLSTLMAQKNGMSSE